MLPLSFLAYQLLSLGAGLLFSLLIARLVRPWADARRPLWSLALEGGALGAAGLVLVLAGRLALAPLGSSALFLPVGMVFTSAVLWGPLRWIPRAVRARSASAALAPAALMALAAVMLFIEPNRLEVTRLSLVVAAEHPAERPIRIAHITDLQTVGWCERERRALAALEAFAPDLILLTGDYATGGADARLAAREFLEKLHAPAGVYAVIGDAEDRSEMAWLMAGLPIHWLDNEGRDVQVAGAQLFLAGVDRCAPDLGRALGGRPPGVPVVLLAHAPDIVLELERSRMSVDLLLAGHTHGGQICLPWIGAPLTLSALPRSCASGLHTRAGAGWLFTGRGLGMEGRFAPRMRLLCRPQVALIELVAQPRRAGVE